MLDRKTTPLTGELKPYLCVESHCGYTKVYTVWWFSTMSTFQQSSKSANVFGFANATMHFETFISNYIRTHTHTHNHTATHTRAFRRIKMVNVENRIDVKTKNGLTISSSSQNYSVCSFVVTHFLLDLVLFVRVYVYVTYDQMSNQTMGAKRFREREREKKTSTRKMAKHFHIDFHLNFSYTHMLNINLKYMWAL